MSIYSYTADLFLKVSLEVTHDRCKASSSHVRFFFNCNITVGLVINILTYRIFVSALLSLRETIDDNPTFLFVWRDCYVIRRLFCRRPFFLNPNPTMTGIDDVVTRTDKRILLDASEKFICHLKLTSDLTSFIIFYILGQQKSYWVLLIDVYNCHWKCQWCIPI